MGSCELRSRARGHGVGSFGIEESCMKPVSMKHLWIALDYFALARGIRRRKCL